MRFVYSVMLSRADSSCIPTNRHLKYFSKMLFLKRHKEKKHLLIVNPNIHLTAARSSLFVYRRNEPCGYELD